MMLNIFYRPFVNGDGVKPSVHVWAKLPVYVQSVLPAHFQMNPYAAHLRVNLYATPPWVNLYVAHSRMNLYAVHMQLNLYAPYSQANLYGGCANLKRTKTN